MTKKLSKSDFSKINELLDGAKIISKKEFDKRVSIFPTWKLVDEGKDFTDMKLQHYDNSNTELIEILNRISGCASKDITSLHTVTYTEGHFLRPHLDRSSKVTLNILLEADCDGGELYIDGKDSGLNFPGDYVIYNGGKQEHEVKLIKKGKRKTLIIWYDKKILM